MTSHVFTANHITALPTVNPPPNPWNRLPGFLYFQLTKIDHLTPKITSAQVVETSVTKQHLNVYLKVKRLLKMFKIGISAKLTTKLASQQCGRGAIPGLGIIRGLSLLVLYSAPRGFPASGCSSCPLSSKANIYFDLICWFQFAVFPISASALERLHT